jgi:hypothetical protein
MFRGFYERISEVKAVSLIFTIDWLLHNWKMHTVDSPYTIIEGKMNIMS